LARRKFEAMNATSWRFGKRAACAAARCEECSGATWGEIDLEGWQWVIPAARRKDTRPNARRVKEGHVVPLGRQAMALLERLSASAANARMVSTGELEPPASSELVFTGGRGAKITNWPRRCSLMAKRLGFHVTPHALRRTCATLAGDCGVAPHVIAALLGHRAIGGTSGAVSRKAIGGGHPLLKQRSEN
jgi:integrase